MSSTPKIAIIGGGAAGFFAAIAAKQHWPAANVCILEKSNKFLSKVKISGGGRCNVTHDSPDINELSKAYPRGNTQLRKAFHQFAATDTIQWFESRGIPLKIYPDGCIFPMANDSQVIIDCFLNSCRQLGVKLHTQQHISNIVVNNEQVSIQNNEAIQIYDQVIICAGGHPKRSSLLWLESIGLEIIEPLPSLFTFNMPKNPICELMGTVVPNATVKIEGTKLSGQGPLLITHWGMSGPAILLLSAWGARLLAEKTYHFHILVNWLDQKKEEPLRQELLDTSVRHSAKKLSNWNPTPLTNRLWLHLLERAEISTELRWAEIGKKGINKLINTLINDRFEVQGKTTFKEEFVTAGGVALSEIDFQTMKSKKFPRLSFAGEVLDIDGITGGFNFQAAWTTGFIAGKHALGK
ncbi:MAG: NAD(P)/FAD-dependent oxidoreductase [Crocinitomicaceae bacterium]|jgi:predicted Rossmann fold flavoprotein|nr:NAD(P)/FAD-dependent oxidoreductase [Crocinitomicaceae bacterium]MDP4723347.1 NAD(P)/FAD-dependent oxidoreductase [Crocinitomicaceae bacterium]MDP4740197.1 NAD(P)/FAD-dependent oxidoreductase [Crocinitomicaceae bacterium]MDP4868868.1 NAD(P)/FAD-dependent oxidoreductase [Crocinitomicaceae bacterium]MDP5066070.1 NAD(P)/FAD-dependent oxidoreductase [Crocinitomicaceae bacterium]